MRDAGCLAAWAQRQFGCPVLAPGQVHGAVIADLDADEPMDWADGLVSRSRDRALGVFGSDCPGLVVDGGAAWGVAHCGWRGCAGGVVGALCHALTRAGAAAPERWHAFIGPGISGPCYEVDAPVLHAAAWPEQALRRRGARADLDLRTVIAAELRGFGLRRLMLAPACTAQRDDLHSFRHNGPGLTQVLAALPLT
ncbi:MAG: polyphenol oxidase family protein [Planctomycetota bacterium]|nr:polyphenol oxidase family protein [Planctomycetota bacterium]